MEAVRAAAGLLDELLLLTDDPHESLELVKFLVKGLDELGDQVLEVSVVTSHRTYLPYSHAPPRLNSFFGNWGSPPQKFLPETGHATLFLAPPLSGNL